jgi:hypothetical protein
MFKDYTIFIQAVWLVVLVCTARQRFLVATTDACVVEPGYNGIGLCDTSSVASDILWYQLNPHC